MITNIIHFQKTLSMNAFSSLLVALTLLVSPTTLLAKTLNIHTLSVTKGSVTDYMPTIFNAYEVVRAKAISYYRFAEKGTLEKQYPGESLTHSKFLFYNSAVDDLAGGADSYCEVWFRNENVKVGYLVVDNIEVTSTNENHLASYYITANFICLKAKQ